MGVVDSPVSGPVGPPGPVLRVYPDSGRWCPNGVEVTVRWTLPHGNAAMVLYQLVGDVPTFDDCLRAADATATWDQDGAGPGLSYRLFRSSNTQLDSVTARSIDPLSRAVAYVTGFGDSAGGAESVSDMLPNQVAPIVDWIALPSQLRRRGRSYLPGCCHNVTRTDDPSRLNADAVPALTACCNGLIGLLGPSLDAVVVLLTTRQAKSPLIPAIPSVIEEASMGAGILGTQRRRNRIS